MAGLLVADYGSDSDSGNDNNSNFTDSDEDYHPVSRNFEDEQLDEPGLAVPVAKKTEPENVVEADVNKEECEAVKDPLSNSVDEDISDSDNEEESDQEEQNLEPEETAAERLPNPLLLEETKPKHSVFSTEYDHREAAKRSVLEKHVKLTDDELEKKKNRPVCKAFLKGKCKYGPRCKFKHEKEASKSGETEQSDNAPVPKAFQHQPVMLQSGHGMDYQPEVVDEDKYGNQYRKRRYGVKDSLVPPKKALQNLDRIRGQERPWTMKK